MTVKEFLERLNRYRVQYFGLQEVLNHGGLTANEITDLYKQQTMIGENIARFVLHPSDDAEILFNRLINND